MKKILGVSLWFWIIGFFVVLLAFNTDGANFLSLLPLIIILVLFFFLLRWSKPKQSKDSSQVTGDNSQYSPLDEHLDSSVATLRKSNGPKGWVYVATMDNTLRVLKIGCNDRDPERRIGESSTGQPGKALLVYAVLVENAERIEGRVHQKLSEYRTHGEWFKCDVGTVVTAIQECTTVLYTDDRRRS